eukprot:CAMPEP_0204294714 /NCGR_PEP_ID=MMETSP0468-20130131/68491_1 /ASSEMBLY_ACC=CAM_ASM_000383 /TAXON_ID=2969 /ORGANISM="Oxyrrhis marina" /LENGTH=54 /DNA_ID=CAMNT_0051273301 /DNA_START=195 /DNA_END=359 /DNA_ORIENTATION=-
MMAAIPTTYKLWVLTFATWSTVSTGKYVKLLISFFLRAVTGQPPGSPKIKSITE